MTNLLHVITELYGSDIDCGLESLHGHGLIAWVVNDSNRRVEKRYDAREADAIAEWLVREAASQRAGRSRDSANTRGLLAELAGSQRKGRSRSRRLNIAAGRRGRRIIEIRA